MARIRSIHPGIYTDEGFATLSMAARVLLIGIWNHADDGGGFEWKPLTLKMRIFPADAVDVSALLDELAGADAVTRYEHDGRSYGAVRNFGKWQKPKKPSRFCPMPEQVRKYAHTTHIKTDDEAKVSSEQNKVETEDKAPSVPPKDETSSEPVPNQSGKSISEGRKGGREEGNTLTSFVTPPSPPSREVTPAMPDLLTGENVVSLPPDARTVLFRQGLDVLVRMTGKPPNAARKLLGKWLKAAKDNAQLLNAILMECSSARPADAIPWIEGAIKNRTGSKLDAMARDWRLDEIDLDAAAEEDCRRMGI
ncbi:hypothetical protein LV478_11685 [Komagataeibacter oboediens]|uniref:hypothetical protein n=1 Tax=Komagataeibacter oboediens TaxID=65958 RepID=UPI0023DB0889|nr:hypothetical protein [Komagataeibacter oboediens]WEQ51191.1 hypothetical protein LV478_11685 [Komagataeibacter oboediens]